MINKKTVLVLGAGANTQYGFPTGFNLKVSICNLLDKSGFNPRNPPTQITRLNELGFNTPSIFKFRDFFAISAIPTIDEFIKINPHFSKIAKASIALVLASCENEGVFILQDPTKSWYHHLFNVMLEDTDYQDFFTANKIKFITYNYDRSLEHFFEYQLRNTFNSISPSEIIKSMNNMEIVHIHGKLGGLDWQGDQFLRNYEHLKDMDDVRAAYNGIITFNDSQEGTQEYIRARKIVRDSERVIFLGFHFHKYNIQRLNSDNCLEECHILGTKKGITSREMEVIRSIIKNPTMYELVDMEVTPFITEYF